MTEKILTESLLSVLKSNDTPTICNAIEVAQGKRGYHRFTKRTMHWFAGPSDVMVGFARTAKIAGNEPSSAPPEATKQLRKDYFRHMAEGPRPGIAVVEDVDGDVALGAWWGEVHVKVHEKVFNLSGAVTNGLVRDLNESSAGFPVLGGGVGPSHGFVHVREFGKPVEIFGMSVADGDLVHADRHGAVVIPLDVLPKLEKALAILKESEGLVLGPINAGSTSFEEFERHWAAFEKART